MIRMCTCSPFGNIKPGSPTSRISTIIREKANPLRVYKPEDCLIRICRFWIDFPTKLLTIYSIAD